jgi:hypothetical protein
MMEGSFIAARDKSDIEIKILVGDKWNLSKFNYTLFLTLHLALYWGNKKLVIVV